MKILPAEKIREADAYTIAHEPVADIDLMERAAMACFNWMSERIAASQTVHVFAGTGNNGGDGLALARMMKLKHFMVLVYLVGKEKKLSPSCRINLDRFKETGGHYQWLEEEHLLPVISDEDVVVDSIFGSGLTRSPEGFPAAIIRHLNGGKALTFSIDVPSGLYCDTSSIKSAHPDIIRADYTLSFAPPKLALFMPENYSYAGDWQLLDIGISDEFLSMTEVKNFVLEESVLAPLLKKRRKFDQKGTYGHALLLCGGYGKMGAAILASHAALRSGAGLVTVHSPSSGVPILQSAVPEVMMSIDKDSSFISEIPDLSRFSAIGTGCGIGLGEQTRSALKLLIQNTPLPLIIDADAINILGENKTWLGFLPKDCIFTPHSREFQRLIGKADDDFDHLSMQKDFSFRFQAYVVSKGAHTAITTPDGLCYFNSSGNPGMATAGSGDVLTGMITGLRAQGYTPLEACLLGVWLHGKAGDIAAAQMGQEALIARDIIMNIGKAFQSLYGKF
jgi:NAD(P)H-hydrate epimerase